MKEIDEDLIKKNLFFIIFQLTGIICGLYETGILANYISFH